MIFTFGNAKSFFHNQHTNVRPLSHLSFDSFAPTLWFGIFEVHSDLKGPCGVFSVFTIHLYETLLYCKMNCFTKEAVSHQAGVDGTGTSLELTVLAASC